MNTSNDYRSRMVKLKAENTSDQYSYKLNSTDGFTTHAKSPKMKQNQGLKECMRNLNFLKSKSPLISKSGYINSTEIGLKTPKTRKKLNYVTTEIYSNGKKRSVRLSQNSNSELKSSMKKMQGFFKQYQTLDTRGEKCNYPKQDMRKSGKLRKGKFLTFFDKRMLKEKYRKNGKIEKLEKKIGLKVSKKRGKKVCLDRLLKKKTSGFHTKSPRCKKKFGSGSMIKPSSPYAGGIEKLYKSNDTGFKSFKKPKKSSKRLKISEKKQISTVRRKKLKKKKRTKKKEKGGEIIKIDASDFDRSRQDSFCSLKYMQEKNIVKAMTIDNFFRNDTDAILSDNRMRKSGSPFKKMRKKLTRKFQRSSSIICPEDDDDKEKSEKVVMYKINKSYSKYSRMEPKVSKKRRFKTTEKNLEDIFLETKKTDKLRLEFKTKATKTESGTRDVTELNSNSDEESFKGKVLDQTHANDETKITSKSSVLTTSRMLEMKLNGIKKKKDGLEEQVKKIRKDIFKRHKNRSRIGEKYPRGSYGLKFESRTQAKFHVAPRGNSSFSRVRRSPGRPRDGRKASCRSKASQRKSNSKLFSKTSKNNTKFFRSSKSNLNSQRRKSKKNNETSSSSNRLKFSPSKKLTGLRKKSKASHKSSQSILNNLVLVKSPSNGELHLVDSSFNFDEKKSSILDSKRGSKVIVNFKENKKKRPKRQSKVSRKRGIIEIMKSPPKRSWFEKIDLLQEESEAKSKIYSETMRNTVGNMNISPKNKNSMKQKSPRFSSRTNYKTHRRAKSDFSENLQQFSRKYIRVPSKSRTRTKDSHNLDQCIELVKDFRIGSVIGKGAFAEVRKVYSKKEDEDTKVIKIYDKYKLIDPIKAFFVKNEIEILEDVDHENIIKILGIYEFSLKKCLLMEFIGPFNLRQYLGVKTTENKLDESQARKIMIKLSSAISYLHKKKIVHRDLKMENVLVNKKMQVKIIDFGFARQLEPNQEIIRDFCGTPCYLSPELISRKPYNPYYADVWALGVILYRILYGVYPFFGSNQLNLYNKIKKCRIKFTGDFSIELFELLRGIFKKDVHERWDIEKVVNCKWLQK